MLKLNNDCTSRFQRDLAGVASCMLFGISASIAVLDRLPVSSDIGVSAYRVLHIPILLAILLFLLSHRQIKWTAYNPTLFLVTGLIIAIIVSGFQPYEVSAAFVNVLRYCEYLVISVLLFMVLRNFWRPSYWIPFSWVLLFTALLSSITVLTDFWGLSRFYSWFTAEQPYVRHMGILGEANYGAAKLCMLLPFILFLESIYLRSRQFWKSLATTGAGLIVVLTIFLSGSRMGGLIAAVTLVVFLLKEIRWLRRPRVAIGVVCALGLLVAVLSVLPQQPISQAFSYITHRYGIVVSFLQGKGEQFEGVKETSLQERIDVFFAGMDMFFSRPVQGVGPGIFPFVIEDFDPNYVSVYSHNTYLSALAELGIAGFIFFVMLCVRILVSIRKMARSSSLQYRGFYSYLCISFVGLLFIFMFLYEFENKYFWTLFLPVAMWADSLSWSTKATTTSM
jgi:O-antigen ligase